MVIVPVQNTRNHAVLRTHVPVIVREEYCMSRTRVTVVLTETDQSDPSPRNIKGELNVTLLFDVDAGS